MQTVTHRLNEYITHKRLSIFAFEMAIGASKGGIAKPLKNHTTFGVNILTRISEVYPDLNMHWLVTGKGEMLIGQPATTETAPPTDAALFKENIELLRENRQLRLELEALKKSTSTVVNKS